MRNPCVHSPIARAVVALACSIALAGCAAELSHDDPQAEVAVYEDALRFTQVGALVSMEAEDFTSSAPGKNVAVNARWVRSTAVSGYSGSAAMLGSPNAGVNVGDRTDGPALNYAMTLSQAGTYYVWVRLRGKNSADDAVHVGVDGRLISYGGLGVADASNTWRWQQIVGSSKRLQFNVAAAGAVTLNVWMREDGVLLDKLLVTRDAAYVPSGIGPVQTVAGSTAIAAPTPAPAPAPPTTSTPTPAPTTSGTCVRARRLWSDDFETGTYARWTSGNYVSSQNGGGCYQSGFSTARAHGGTRSHHTSISCAQSSNHRIYGGVQFSGDTPLSRYTNTGTGIDAPDGIVITYFTWLDAPGFGSGKWFSFLTSNNSCSWSDTVVTYGLEDSGNRINPAHITNTGGTLTYAGTRSAYPMRQWVRQTLYLNYHSGVMHMWQNGQKQWQATFRRPTKQICQFHWGLYASGANTSISLFEDDFSIWKLDQPLASFDVEPWLGQTRSVCP